MKNIFASLFLIVGLFIFGVQPTVAATTLKSDKYITFSTLNPCNGHNLTLSAQMHVNGDIFVLSNARAYDPATPLVIFPVVYNYGSRGNRVFNVTFIVQQPGARYQEHQVFIFDQNGVLTRYLISKVCR